MKKYLLPGLKMTLVMIVLLAVVYPAAIAMIAKMSKGGGKGETISVNGKVVGYANIGQQFSDDKYFQGRPSAVGYNPAGSGGSNKGATNADYLKTVQDRIDTFLVHNPGIAKASIPAELVTASGSGLDPHLSPVAAKIQVKRIAAIRNLDEATLNALVDQHTKKPLLGMLGTSTVNVLQLNIALDKLK
ncbi:K(+)-transporting ATPase subunit C [Pseudoflavitalea sp. G-6-1-2]|uniref:K(+)-transporting ATPase subunit C n=1 Tax=Pseudoflavitalea sp. G-6-1-2 TaxID=2728841 RepID=UPI001469D031|nr:K(+)-transporting ATPase subunit C [Pseudoflavitalea sp. G-6-1-2]NML19580.1 K(+)-transporting ATPase subunit C [Pseudoflavitalea sp. G-6-1-2]